MVRDGANLQQLLGLRGDLNVRRLRQLVRLAELCESPNRPDESWFEVSRLRQVAQALPSMRERFEERDSERKSILAEYDPGVLELDTKDLIGRFSESYSSFFRVFRPGYYRSKGLIKALR